jgi:hypothetical protein
MPPLQSAGVSRARRSDRALATAVGAGAGERERGGGAGGALTAETANSAFSVGSRELV